MKCVESRANLVKGGRAHSTSLPHALFQPVDWLKPIRLNYVRLYTFLDPFISMYVYFCTSKINEIYFLQYLTFCHFSFCVSDTQENPA